jgi:hypothetical protein
MQKLTEEEFMEVAKSWYKDYLKTYDHSYNKTEIRPFNLGMRPKTLKEFFKNSNDWKDYHKHSNAIRAYRNVITHSVKIASFPHSDNDKVVFVPKKEKIHVYKRWEAVLQASSDLQKLKNDFVNARHQMKLDIELLEDVLNKLWLKPLEELKRLFFEENNKVLLQKYNIDLSSLTPGQP